MDSSAPATNVQNYIFFKSIFDHLVTIPCLFYFLKLEKKIKECPTTIYRNLLTYFFFINIFKKSQARFFYYDKATRKTNGEK